MPWHDRDQESKALERVLQWIIAALIMLAMLSILVACAQVQVGPKELSDIATGHPHQTPPPLPKSVHLNFEEGHRLEPGDIDSGGKLMLEWWACLRHPEVKCPRY